MSETLTLYPFGRPRSNPRAIIALRDSRVVEAKEPLPIDLISLGLTGLPTLVNGKRNSVLLMTVSNATQE